MVESRIFQKIEAENVAGMLYDGMKPFCERIKVCGGLRRKNDTVHDIDIVVQPFDFFSISSYIGGIGGKSTRQKFMVKYDGIPVEIWIAYDEPQFEVMKLVRTGSAGFNLNIASYARDSNMVLRFGNGLYGLYAAVKGYNKERRKSEWYVNPLRRLHWEESDIIATVFGTESKFLVPENRNVQFGVYEEPLQEEF